MSNESLILLALLFLLPLVQQLLEAARQRSRSSSAPAERPPLRMPRPAPPPVSPPPVLVIPPRLEMAHELLEQTTAPERADLAATSPRRPARDRPGLRTRPGLRRAIILTAVLGQCRAVEPHGSAGGADRRSP